MWEHKWISLISVSPTSQLFLRLFKSFFEVIETRKTAQWENGAFKVAVYLGFCLKFLQNWIKLKMTLVAFLFYNNVFRNVTYVWGLKREKLKLECIVLIMMMLRHLCTSNWHIRNLWNINKLWLPLPVQALTPVHPDLLASLKIFRQLRLDSVRRIILEVF